MADKEKTSPKFEDPNHPLHLHHSDHPGVILVSQPLAEDNYSTWSRAMMMALRAKNKVGFVDGSLEKPSSSSAAELQQWNRCNDMVKSWLLNSLSREIAPSVIYCDLALEIWAELKERFSQVSSPHVFQIEREIHNISQDTMSVVTYFTKLKGLWDELSSLCASPSCTCGAMTEALRYQQRQRTMKFLMGLNEPYFIVCGQILLMDPLPSVNRAYSLVFQEECQREVSSYKPTTLDVAALMVKENLNAQEHKNYKNAGKKKGEKNERPKCTHCRWEGHTIDTCYRIHGYPPGHRLHKASSQPSANQVSLPMIENKASGGVMLSQEQYQQLLALLSDANKSPMAHNVGSTFYHVSPVR